MDVLPEYEIETVLDEDSAATLYRARDREGRRVLVKAMKATGPSPVAYQLLRRELELTRLLGSDVAVEAEQMSVLDGHPILVLHDDGETPLACRMGVAIELGVFLPLSIRLADVLSALHTRQVVHLGLTPHHVMLAPSDERMRLTGFSNAEMAPVELKVRPNRWPSSLWPYLSPEQTGRLGLPIDHRSDLYSLGVIFFELLTGHLPFAAGDLLGWLHCHCAGAAPSPNASVPTLPAPVAEIVLKLLAKLPDDRYQSASGVSHDLARCLQMWTAGARIEPFALGEADVPPPLRLAAKVYGRECEIGQLKNALARAGCDSRAQVLFVSGPSGIGKTELVGWLRRVVTERKALFATGKCDAVGQSIPYAAVLQALEAVLVESLEEGRESLDELRDRMTKALRLNAALLAGVLPALAQIVGGGASPELSLEDAERRFWLTLTQFIGAFAQPQRPLVLFLDDLQWADPGTLKVIEHWATDPSVHHTLFIGAFRSTDVPPSHLLRRMIVRTVQKGGDVYEMALEPLSVEAVTRWVVDSLHSRPEDTAPLAELIHEKTGGNPFFVAQFVESLVREHLVYFSTDSRLWCWDLPKIRAERYSSDVADFIAANIRNLAPDTQEALRLFACHGGSVDLPTLAILLDCPEHTVMQRMESAFTAGLIARVDHEVRFLHDHILQVSCQLTPAERQAETHLAIGRALLSHLDPEQLADRIFEVVHHINAGASKIVTPGERVRAAELNLMAARKAKAPADHDCATGFSATGIALLGDGGWETDHDLAFNLELTLAQCHYATGDLAAAQELCRGLLARVGACRIEAAAVYGLVADMQTHAGEWEAAIESSLKGLRLFGIDLSAQPTDAEVDVAYDATLGRLADRSMAALLELPPMTDANTRAKSDLIAAVYLPAIQTDHNLFFLSASVAVDLSLVHGNTSSSTTAYGAFALGLAMKYRRYREAFAWGQAAYRLAQRQEHLAHRARTILAFALLSPLGMPLRDVLEMLRNESHVAMSTADSLFGCYFSDQAVHSRLFAGDHLDEVHEEACRCFAFVERAGNSLNQDILRGHQRLIERLRGSSQGARVDKAVDEDLGRRWIAPGRHALCELQARFILGDVNGALEAAERVQPSVGSVGGLLAGAEYHFYAALALAWSRGCVPHEGAPGCLEALQHHWACLDALAESCPDNFAHLASIVSAEVAHCSGDELGAEHAYEQAIRAARAGGFVHIEAIASEVCAQFHRQRGFETTADAYLAQARDCYEAWGARAKVEALTRQYPQLTRPEGAAGNGSLDMLGILKASQAISSALLLPDLHARLLSVALEQAGAERGCLLLVSPRGLVLAGVMGADAGAFGTTDRVPEPHRLPLSLCTSALRTGRPVILVDAAVPNRYTTDPYFVAASRRSVLCLPIIRQEEVVGLLYLENNLVPGAFSGARLSVLDVLASQAAISLENARLYTKLRHENAERKRAEAAARKGKALVQAIIDNTPAVICVKDPEGRYLLVNRRFKEFFHIPGDEIVGKTDRELRVQKADICRASELAVLRENRAIESEEPIVQQDGMHTYMSVKFPLRDSAGNPYAVCSIAADVTSLKRTTEELRHSLSLLKATLDSTADGILVVDTAGRIVEFNRRFTDLWRIPEAILAERDDDKALGFVLDQVESPGEFLNRVRSLYDEPWASSFDVLKFKDGRVFERYSQPQHLAGQVIGRVWSFRDVTQRVEAEQQRDTLLAEEKRARTEAEEAVRLRDEFLSVASHELRTPLTSLQLAIQGLEQRLLQGMDVERAHWAVALAGRQIKRLGNLLGLLLEVSRIQQGRLGLNRTEVDLATVVQEVTTQFTDELTRSGCVLTVHADEPVTGMWDGQRLEQVVTNLLTNAIKFGKSKPIEIAIATDGQTARLSVTDHGIGIPRHMQGRIFERFQRGVSAKHYGGLGLGLYITRTIVHAHGGTVCVTSEVGEGSTFTVELPLVLEAPPESKVR